ncbi:hypothetical protein [Streptomyces sp. NPDC090022]|uniref:hypothetical protein n=1 Tax=Streptomyces sp. NPDC090022 TaxID=3365920 RepID=UPI00380D609E
MLTTLGTSPTAFGVIMGAGGVGSLAGALFASRFTDRFGVGPVIIAGFAVSPLAQVPLLLAGPGHGWQIVLAAALAVQLFWATAAGVTQRTFSWGTSDLSHRVSLWTVNDALAVRC